MSRPGSSQLEDVYRADSCPFGRITWRSASQSAIRALRLPSVWVPLILLGALTAYFRWTNADLDAVRPFFAGIDAGESFDERWPVALDYPWKALYDWGTLPAWILGGGGAVVWLVSFKFTKLVRWRDSGLFLMMALIIGPGLIVNGVLKPWYGRPRPNALVEFGGERDFLPVLTWGFGQNESSFPSGHASTGFFLMTPAFIYYRRRPRLAAAFIALGIFGGCTVGLARIVAGGHFPSDVLWSGGIVYFTGLALAVPFGFATGTPMWRRTAD